MKKKVFIVGSAVDGLIEFPDEAVIYVANSAISRINPILDHKLVHVTSVNILDPEIIKTEEHLITRRKALINRSPVEQIIYPSFTKMDLSVYKYNEMNYSPALITLVSQSKFWKLILRAAGISTLKYSLFQDKGLLYNSLRLIKHLFGYPIVPYFIPSTGILALLMAIDKYGLEAEYILDGFNPSSKDFWYEGKHFVASSDKPPHTDSIILKYLEKKYILSYNL